MSLSPQVRRERRAQAAKYREPKKFPRRRCANDGKWFLKTRKNKKFCCPACKDEYNRFGSAFGPLRDYLTKLIGEQSKEAAAAQFAAYVAGKDFRRQLAAAGFIHRSMMKPKPANLAPHLLAGRIDALLEILTAAVSKLDALTTRVFKLETGRLQTESNVTAALDAIDRAEGNMPRREITPATPPAFPVRPANRAKPSPRAQRA